MTATVPTTIAEAPTPKTVKAYKAFGADWTCRGFQFEVGKTYDHDGPVVPCESGFHACLRPIDLLRYYPNSTSKFAVVEVTDPVADDDDEDSKVAAPRITITAEITLGDIIERTVAATTAAAKLINGSIAKADNEAVAVLATYGAASASGRYSVATASRDHGTAATSGSYSVATALGYFGASTTSGILSVATASGPYGRAAALRDCSVAIARGDYGAAIALRTGSVAIASGYSGTATASGHHCTAIASGRYSVATALRDYSTATASGDHGTATALGRCGRAIASGLHGKAAALGLYGRASGAEGNTLSLCERRKDDTIIHVWSGIVGVDGIAPDTFYTLWDGKPVVI